MGPGSVVDGRYLLVSVIGAGGAGVVWHAVQQPFGRVVALKQIPLRVPGGEPPDRVRARTLREARNTSVLHGSEHVIGVTDYFEDDDDVWLVLEYVDALNLAELVAATGPLPPDEVAWIGARVARALAAGHDLDIQHRDVKPGNVLVGRDGATVKLGDYGISRREDDPDVTVLGSVPATLPYAAPEVVREHRTTTASDIWSLGATLYHAVEGAPPFGHHDDRIGLIEALRTGRIEPMQRAGPALAPLLERMLVPTTLGRIDADTIAEKLDGIATPLSGPTRQVLADHRPHRSRRFPGATRLLDTPPPATRRSFPPRVPRWLRRVPARPVALALAGVLVAVLATAGLIASRPAARPAASAPAAPAAPTTDVAGLGILPADVGPFGLGARTDDVDLCQLVDLAALGAYGRTTAAPGYQYEECRALTTTADGTVVTGFDVATVSSPPSSPRRSVVNVGSLVLTFEAVPVRPVDACQDHIDLSDGSEITVYSYLRGVSKVPSPLCDVADAATVGAVRALARIGHVPRDADRPAGLALAGEDACTLVDRAVIPEVTGPVHVGFHRWSCEVDSDSGESLNVLFILDDPFDHHDRIGNYWADLHIQGTGSQGNNRCLVDVEIRAHATLGGAEYKSDMVEFQSDGPAPLDDQCARAERAARAAVPRLPPPA